MGSARLKLDVALPCCVAIGRFAIQTILPAQDPFVIVCNECYARCAAQSGAHDTAAPRFAARSCTRHHRNRDADTCLVQCRQRAKCAPRVVDLIHIDNFNSNPSVSACPVRWTPLPGTRGPCVPVSSDQCGSAIRPRASRCIRCLGPACIQKNGRTTENHGPVPGKRAGPPPNQAILNKHRGFSSKHESFQVGPFGPIGPFGPGARSVLSSSGEHGSSPGSLSGGADSYVLRVGTKLPQ